MSEMMYMSENRARINYLDYGLKHAFMREQAWCKTDGLLLTILFTALWKSASTPESVLESES